MVRKTCFGVLFVRTRNNITFVARVGQSICLEPRQDRGKRSALQKLSRTLHSENLLGQALLEFYEILYTHAKNILFWISSENLGKYNLDAHCLFHVCFFAWEDYNDWFQRVNECTNGPDLNLSLLSLCFETIPSHSPRLFAVYVGWESVLLSRHGHPIRLYAKLHSFQTPYLI